MTSSDREQAALIVSLETRLAETGLAQRLNAMLREQSARGRFHSGSTVHRALHEIHAAEIALLDVLQIKISAVATDRDTYDFLSDAVLEFRGIGQSQFDGVTRRLGEDFISNMEAAIKDICDKHEVHIRERLKLALFNFGGNKEAPQNKSKDDTQNSPPVAQNTGGRPKGAFWDELWTEMAADLFNGDLKPATQADIERAMSGWITKNGHSAAPSTIRSRARMLWKRVKP